MPSSMITATAQAAILSAASNLSAQFLGAYQAKHTFSLDYIQLTRFVLLTILTAPPNYQWQLFLEKTFPMFTCTPSGKEPVSDSRDLEKGGAGHEIRGAEPGSKPKLSIRNTLSKWFFDCITLGAMINTIVFLILMGLMKGQSMERIGQTLRTETIPLIFASYKVWPLASIISFSFVPVEKRIVFLSFVGLLWGVYMSLVAAKI